MCMYVSVEFTTNDIMTNSVVLSPVGMFRSCTPHKMYFDWMHAF